MRWNEIFKETVIKLGATKPTPDSPAMKFIEELNQTYPANPFNERQRVIGTAKVEVSAVRNSLVHISDITGTGGGSGTKALQELCRLADKYNVTLELTAYGYADTPSEALVRWYKKHGFFEVGDDEDAMDMKRNPN